MLLALDTATTTASIALYHFDTRAILAELTWQARRRQTQDLLPALENVLRLVDLTPAALSALAVTTGPGSFTGVRIAISAAKGMALGLPQPPRIVGIPTLSVTAAPYLSARARGGSAAAGAGGEFAVCAAIQAGRSRYNWAWFDPAGPLHRPGVEEHGAGSVAEFAAALAERQGAVRLVGELGSDLRELLAVSPNLQHVQPIDSVSGLRRAGQLARLAALHLDAGTCDTVESLQPLYLRAP
jgi:tRNA threonylcarbamoyladenosine biosynthesis protein TsaB